MCLNVATSLSVEFCFIDYKISVSCFSDKAQKKNYMCFPLTLPTLIFCAYPKVFLTIFE
jgi:hypothetical protein